MVFEDLADSVGKVISENPYVKLLTKPKYEEYEVVPGFSKGRWEALAIVEGTLAIIELNVNEVTRCP